MAGSFELIEKYLESNYEFQNFCLCIKNYKAKFY